MKNSNQGKFLLIFSSVIVSLALILIFFIIFSIITKDSVVDNGDVIDDTSLISSTTSDVSSISSDTSSITPDVSSSEPAIEEEVNEVVLDKEFSNLLLVNAKNPLPEDYDYEGNLGRIDSKYINGSLNQINKDVLPYLTAMIDAAWNDGVKLYVRSPYRSYSTQKMLFEAEVNKWLNTGLDRASAEEKASTIVARPGTSGHHTGLSIDFNVAADKFATTPMYTWLCENAADYGFIMRYPKEKQSITGVIYESWHWRFVGINIAKEIKEKGVCLEEYLNQAG